MKTFKVKYGFKSMRGYEGVKIMHFSSLYAARVLLTAKYPKYKFYITEVEVHL